MPPGVAVEQADDRQALLAAEALQEAADAAAASILGGEPLPEPTGVVETPTDPARFETISDERVEIGAEAVLSGGEIVEDEEMRPNPEQQPSDVSPDEPADHPTDDAGDESLKAPKSDADAESITDEAVHRVIEEGEHPDEDLKRSIDRARAHEERQAGEESPIEDPTESATTRD